MAASHLADKWMGLLDQATVSLDYTILCGVYCIYIYIWFPLPIPLRERERGKKRPGPSLGRFQKLNKFAAGVCIFGGKSGDM